MKNKETEEIIIELSKKLSDLQIEHRAIEQKIQVVKKQLSKLATGQEVIDKRHIVRRCRVLNLRLHQPSVGTIVGLTKGQRPFIKVKEQGYQEIKRIAKNLQLLLEPRK